MDGRFERNKLQYAQLKHELFFQRALQSRVNE